MTLQGTCDRGAGIMIKKIMINEIMLKVLSVIGWIIVGCAYGLCRLVNKIYGVFGGLLTVLLILM